MAPAHSVIIGAGIVGLHLAQALLLKGHEVYVLEQEPFLAEHTSGRNSGVIHAGIFYKSGSLKERFCIEGNTLTYEWVERLNVPHRRCGKWVVPDPGQEDLVPEFFSRVLELPIPKPLLISADQVAHDEPALRCTEAVLIPSTGILDAATYVKSLSRYVESQGAQVILNCRVEGISNHMIHTQRGDIPFDILFNSAGLFANQIAAMDGLEGYEIRPCRGDYYLALKSPISRPVYHIPSLHDKGLGVHLTLTVEGELLIGPNAFYIDDITDYKHRSSEEAYRASVEYYLPNCPPLTLSPAYSGNRPKLYYKGQLKNEFEIVKTKSGIHLLGIESPGLTSAPALAKHVMELIS